MRASSQNLVKKTEGHPFFHILLLVLTTCTLDRSAALPQQPSANVRCGNFRQTPPELLTALPFLQASTSILSLLEII